MVRAPHESIPSIDNHFLWALLRLTGYFFYYKMNDAVNFNSKNKIAIPVKMPANEICFEAPEINMASE